MTPIALVIQKRFMNSFSPLTILILTQGAVTKKNQSLPHQREAKMPFDALQNKKDKEIFSKENFPTTTKALTLFQNDPLVCKPGELFFYSLLLQFYKIHLLAFPCNLYSLFLFSLFQC